MKPFSHADLVRLLSLGGKDDLARLYAAALATKTRAVGRRVSVRGLIEASNACAKDCFYCGIRASNVRVTRYRLTEDEIVRAAEAAVSVGYASVVIQAGELESEENTAFYERVLRRLRPLDLGVTLSLGEQEETVYRRWREAGAERYLLRIETSNPRLYARLHPASHDWSRRVECLRTLRRAGYQVGTGVMCALPGQTADDLARDVEFFGEIDADMIGMGPYLPHPDTPLAREARARSLSAEERLAWGLKMIAVTRLAYPDLNVAASTALQALAPDGRLRGLLAGANVIMPNVTDAAHRRAYALYEGKPDADEGIASARDALVRELSAVGETPLFGVRGDSLHFLRRSERTNS